MWWTRKRPICPPSRPTSLTRLGVVVYVLIGRFSSRCRNRLKTAKLCTVLRMCGSSGRPTGWRSRHGAGWCAERVPCTCAARLYRSDPFLYSAPTYYLDEELTIQVLFYRRLYCYLFAEQTFRYRYFLLNFYRNETTTAGWK